MIAVLPMYDWPEVRAATDGLWSALRDGFRGAGLCAPDELSRDVDLRAAWGDRGLILGQTCGLPFANGMRVALIGAPDYGVPGCAPGAYRSAVVVRRQDPRETLAAFRGARLALNGFDSQSGYAAVLHHVAPLSEGRRFFGASVVTGAHLGSALCVAEDRADIAAIDYISWRLIQAFRPEAAGLRVLMLTDPTPGLPFIAAEGTDVERHRRVVAEAIARVEPGVTGLRGFVPFDPADYDVIRDRLSAAEARVSL